MKSKGSCCSSSSIAVLATTLFLLHEPALYVVLDHHSGLFYKHTHDNDTFSALSLVHVEFFCVELDDPFDSAYIHKYHMNGFDQ
jgi:hypothetical protein